MKKIIALMTVLVLLLGSFASGEEDKPLFATLGQAMEEAEYTGIAGGDDTCWVILVVKDGTPIRVIAYLTEESNALNEARFEGDWDEMEAADAAFEEHLKTLSVARTEEITVQPLTQEELDSYAGKSISEMNAAGFEDEGIGGSEDGVTYEAAFGVYLYEFAVAEDYEAYEQRSEEGDFSDLTVKSGRFVGFSRNAADLHYHADGTVEMAQDGWSQLNGLFETISQALEEAQADGEVDKDAIVSKLLGLIPDADEEELRGLVELFLLLGDDAESFEAAE